jgi:hypothetical protein
MIVLYLQHTWRNLRWRIAHSISAMIVISQVLFIVLMDCLFSDEDEDDAHNP